MPNIFAARSTSAAMLSRGAPWALSGKAMLLATERCGYSA